MYLWWSSFTLYLHTSGESYHRQLRSLLYLRYVFQALINSLVHWNSFQFQVQFEKNRQPNKHSMLIGCDMTKSDKTEENNKQRKWQRRGRHKASKKSHSKVRQPLRQFICAIGEYKIPTHPSTPFSFSFSLVGSKGQRSPVSKTWDKVIQPRVGWVCKAQKGL